MPTYTRKLPHNYDANARCEFHFGGVGHTVENCLALKYKVEDLLDTKAIQFDPLPEPNIIQNLMLPHVWENGNAIS